MRFEQVGAFRRPLAAIPVALVERSDLELAGAAAAMRDHAQGTLAH